LVPLVLLVFLSLSQLQRANPVILAIADVDRAVLNEDSVGPRKFAGEGIAVGAVPALTASDNSRNGSFGEVDPTDDVILRVGYIKAVVRRIRHALRSIQSIARSAELR